MEVVKMEIEVIHQYSTEPALPGYHSHSYPTPNYSRPMVQLKFTLKDGSVYMGYLNQITQME